MTIDSNKILYVYNINDEYSQQLAVEYSVIRQVPGINLLGLDVITSSLFSSRSEFERVLLNPIINKINSLGSFPETIHACVLGYRVPAGYRVDDYVVSCCSAISAAFLGKNSVCYNPSYRKCETGVNIYDMGVMPCCQQDMPSFNLMKKKLSEFSGYRNGIKSDGSLYFDRWSLKKDFIFDYYASELNSFEINFIKNYFSSYLLTSKPIDNLRSDFGFAEKDSFFWSAGMENLTSSFFLSKNRSNRIFFFNADSDSFISFRSDNAFSPAIAALNSGYASSAGMMSSIKYYFKGDISKPEVSFDEKFNLVFDYLISRYEPEWIASTEEEGKSATLQSLNIDPPINPLTLGGLVEDAFNYSTGNVDIGWFDPITHPKKFATAVKSSYVECTRARNPQNASDRFINLNLNAILCQDILFQGGNAYFGLHPNFSWQETNHYRLHHGYDEAYKNGVRRHLIHSPYGHMSSPMNSLAGNWRRFPYLSDRYTSESFQFDMYLLINSNTTIRDLLPDKNVIREPNLGVTVNGQTDIHLNTEYSTLYFPAGTYSRLPYDDYTRTSGGFGENQVAVGSPWIPIDGISYSSWGGSPGERATLHFDRVTLVTNAGNLFPDNPPSYVSFNRPPMSNSIGLRFDYGQKIIESLDLLSSQYGDNIEFIAYLGCLPYGSGFEMRIPFGLYRDPTIPGNSSYFNWRLDASVSHWKQKFLSPINGFANIIMDASAIIERTYHMWQPPDYSVWKNIANSGEEYVENIPVIWARKQYDFTYGQSGPIPEKGIVLGVEKFAQYMFKDDVGILYPDRNDQRRFSGDANPRHWCLDDDIACTLYSTLHDITIGQRKWGLEYAYSIWGGNRSKLGEIIADVSASALVKAGKSVLSGFPFFYNTFMSVDSNGDIYWKYVRGTDSGQGYDNEAGMPIGVSWVSDRRFRLFYLYPTLLSLNITIQDEMYTGTAYYNKDYGSGWFDKNLGTLWLDIMEEFSFGSVVSNVPYPERRTPSSPPKNFWTGNIETSEFELLYACMKGGIREGLDSLLFNKLYDALSASQNKIDPYYIDPYSSDVIETSDCWLRPEPFFQSLSLDYTLLESMYFSSPLLCCPMTYFCDPMCKVIFNNDLSIPNKFKPSESWSKLHEIFSECSALLLRRINSATALIGRAGTYKDVNDKIWAFEKYKGIDTNNTLIQISSQINPAFSAWKKFAEVAYFDKFDGLKPTFIQIINNLDFKLTNAFIRLNVNSAQLDSEIEPENKQKKGAFILETVLPDVNIGTGFYQVRADIYLDQLDTEPFASSSSFRDRQSWRFEGFDKSFSEFPPEGIFSSLKNRKIKFYNNVEIKDKNIGDTVWVKLTFTLDFKKSYVSDFLEVLVLS